MRIFTLGKNGIPLFFFALILFSGTYSSYGQECPDVVDQNSELPGNQQYFCNSAALEDLMTEGDTVQFFSDADTDTPLPSSTTVVSGTTYYVEVDNCERTAVEVIILDQPEILGVEAGSFNRKPASAMKQTLGRLELCVGNLDAPGVSVSDFRTNMPSEALRWYKSSSLNSEPELITDPVAEELQTNTYYYAEPYVQGAAAEEITFCRARTLVILTAEEAPQAQDIQEFCASDEPTLADIVADGQNNYYNSATSQVALRETNSLVDGRTYYVSTVGEACESEARTAVTVRLLDINAGQDSIENIFCVSEIQRRLDEGQSARDIFLSLLDEGVSREGTFDTSIENISAAFDTNQTGTFTTTYTVTNELGCEDQVELAITVEEDPEAGEPVSIEVCASEFEGMTEEEAEEYLLNLFQGDPEQYDPAGFDQEELITEAERLDINNPAGTYSVTYTDTVGICKDEAAITVTVIQDPIAGSDNSETYCITELSGLVQDDSDFEQLFFDLLSDEATADGTFSPSLEELANTYSSDPIGDFTTTYTVTEGECSDSATLTINVQDVEEANAGTIADQTYCVDEDTVDLYTLLSDDASEEGTFSGEGVVEGKFTPSSPGSFEITYTVGEATGACVTGETSTTFTINVSDDNFVAEAITINLCEDQISPDLTEQVIDNYYRAQIAAETDLPEGGTLDPSPAELLTRYNEDRFRDFPSTYTVDTECGTASVEITVTVIENQNAAVGEINDIPVACDANELIVLDSSILPAGTTPGGTFTSEEGVLAEDGNFDPAVVGPGSYEITYTVSDSQSCVTGDASGTFTITVGEGTLTEESITDQVCEDQVTDPTVPGFTSYYENLLVLNEIPRGGEFEPTMADLVDQYNQNSTGTFTTTYSYVEDCTRTEVELSITILPSVESEDFDDINLVFCAVDDEQNLNDYLPEGYPAGTFEGHEDGLFDPSNADTGVTTVNYVITPEENTCIAGGGIIAFNITVNELRDADAGDDVEVVYCVSQDTDIQLTSLLSEGAHITGSFSAPFESGVFNPATQDIGEYVITYTVDGEEDCAIGTDSSEIRITVVEDLEAPLAEDFTFCVVQGATVANLSATGENLRWYTDESLNTPADEDELLQERAYYVTQTTSGGCESEAATVNVTLTDAAAPTLEEEGNVFCQYDRPTIATLNENIIETGTVTWYDAPTGGNVYNSEDLLQHGATYYATITDATSGCEGADRLAVTVILENCEVLIPEAFSPNGDEINDRFVLEHLTEQYPNYSIEIFNRWGNTVYKGNANTPYWNGVSTESRTLGDNVLPVGVYFYILNYNDGQTAPTQGRVYLSR